MTRVAIVVLFLLVLGACGGGGEVGTSGPESPDVVVAGLPGEMAFVGGLAGTVGDPTTILLGNGGGRHELGAAVVVVPGAASDQSVAVAAWVVDLAVDAFVSDGPTATLYVLSTEEDVELGAPLEMEVPLASERTLVSVFVDGVWADAGGASGDASSITIDHFSTVAVAVVEPSTTGSPPELDEADRVPGEFFVLCVEMLTRSATNSGMDIDDVRAHAKWVMVACTRALVDYLTPDDRSVPLSCVNRNVSDAVDVRAAVGICLADQDRQEEPASDESEATSQPVEVGPLEWSGDMTPTRLGSPWVSDGTASVYISRIPGTNAFEIVMGASISATGSVTGCVSTEDKTFEGTGTLFYEGRIDFEGTYVNDRSTTCSEEAVDQDIETTLIVDITQTGLHLSNWEGFSFDLPGVPPRIDE